MLTTLFLAAFLASAPLPVAVATDPGLAPAEPAAAAQAAPADPAPAQDPGFATWLASEEALPAPAFELAAACRTCAQCPSSHPFCCILASGCASCTTRPTVCANGG